uniref:Uncharacterized protein n=1 Tax=Leersia perrieri TaxID=77586 RepID=A0A0D9UW20_9ORYZ
MEERMIHSGRQGSNERGSYNDDDEATLSSIRGRNDVVEVAKAGCDLAVPEQGGGGGRVLQQQGGGPWPCEGEYPCAIFLFAHFLGNIYSFFFSST